MRQNLYFGRGNAKVDALTFSLPCGHSCPFAKFCLAKLNPKTRKIESGKEAKIRCYAVNVEVLFPKIFDSRWRNLQLLKKCDKAGMVALLNKSIAKSRNPKVRIHASGDFFSQTYFDSWLEIAKLFPQKLFYGYTKALPFWIKRINDIPKNFKLVASKGGICDNLIDKYHLPYVQVVFSQEEAKKLGLELDHDDSLAEKADKSFAILLHGAQNKNTVAGKAWYKIMHSVGGYKTNYFLCYKKNKKDNNKK